MERRPARLGRSRAVAAFAMLFGVAAGLAPLASPAGADPLSNDRAEAAQLTQTIAQEQQEVETLSNQFDDATIHLQQVQARVASAQKALKNDQGAVGGIRKQLAVEAVNAYTSGGFTNSAAQAPTTNLSPLVANSYFEVATGNQTDTIDQYKLAERNLATQQQALSQAQSAAKQAVSQLSTKRQQAAAAQAQANKTLSGVKGQIAQLVAQQQREAQERLAQQQRAEQERIAQQQEEQQQQAAAAQATAASAGSGLGGPAQSAPATTAAPASTAPAPSTTAPPATTAAPAPAPVAVPSPGGAASTAVSVALGEQGVQYTYGGSSPATGFDCSGLVMYAYAAAGVSLPHSTYSQWDMTTHIPLADAQPGDLIFFNGEGHVGIYLGNGQMVDAPHTGTVVRVESIYGFGSIDGATRVG